ncbi:MAG: choice-of-anchor B family protein [Bacteroidetes bacterium]|nr:choice-of-anchor B family protein [Bacteroidota bacterium]
MKKGIFLIISMLLFQIATAQIQQLQKLSQIDFPTTCAGVWHYVDSVGNEYALLGNGDGVVIVEVTDPVNPVVLFTVPAASSLWREIKTYGHYAYAGTEGGGGITIIDLSNLPASYTSKIYDGDGAIAGQISSSHTVQVFDDYLYIFGSTIGAGGAIMCNLQDPWNPVYEGIYNGNYIHDGYVLNDTLYASEIYQGQFSVVDVTDKANPVILATQPTPGAFNHNSWFSDNRQYLYTTDEYNNTPLGVFDVSDIQDIKLVDTYLNDSLPDKEVHNVRVLNDFLINPSYGSQLTIVDGARPENLIEIARHATGGFLCWDASPYLPSGNIIATDMDGHFYVFAPYFVRACYLEGNITDLVTGLPIENTQVKILATPTISGSNLIGDYKTGYPTPGTFDVEFSKGGYVTKVETGVVLANGVLTILNVQLQPFSATIEVINSITNQPVPFAKVKLQNATTNLDFTANALGIVSLNTISSGNFDITAALWGYKSGCVAATLAAGGTITIPIEPGIYDDFTFDFGWTVSGNAADGNWEAGEPVGTTFSSTQANPDFDVTNDCSDRCFVTGNGGGPVNDDDVDDGSTILTSPVFDLTSFTDPYINYSRWFFEQFSSNPAGNDTLFITMFNGAATQQIEFVTGPSPTNSTWQEVGLRILDYISLSNTMQVIVTISDKPGSTNPLEAAFDKFEISEGPLTISENLGVSSIQAFPNPFNTGFDILISEKNLSVNTKMVITDVSGRIIHSQPVVVDEKISIRSTNWANGIYFIRLFDGEKVFAVQKMVKM